MLKIYRKYKYKELRMCFLQMFHGMHYRNWAMQVRETPSMHAWNLTHTQSTKKPHQTWNRSLAPKRLGGCIIAITREIKKTSKWWPQPCDLSTTLFLHLLQHIRKELQLSLSGHNHHLDFCPLCGYFIRHTEIILKKLFLSRNILCIFLCMVTPISRGM